MSKSKIKISKHAKKRTNQRFHPQENIQHFIYSNLSRCFVIPKEQMLAFGVQLKPYNKKHDEIFLLNYAGFLGIIRGDTLVTVAKLGKNRSRELLKLLRSYS